MTFDASDYGAIPEYVPEPTPRLFHASKRFVRGLKGPVGSSKSSACCEDLLMKAFNQKPWKDGVRRTRFAIIRKTYNELLNTTIKTWQEWCPEAAMHITMSPPPHGRMVKKLADGTTVDMEVIFLALDEEKDVDKLRSLELTMAWFNEAKEILKAHVDMATSRVRRYPSPKLGGPSFTGIIMDTNPPHDKSWWYKLSELECPKNYEFFDQPPAVIEVPRKNDDDPLQFIPNQGQGIYPPAENIRNLNGGFLYYMEQIGGKDRDWIRVNLEGLYGQTLEGKPIYHEYNDDIHCAKFDLKVMRGLPIIVGMDLGLTPSVVFLQMSPMGQLRIVDELWSDDLGIRSFARDHLVPHVRNNYEGMELTYVIDPAGKQRDQNTEITTLEVLAECGLRAELASTNSFEARREAVAYFMLQARDGMAGFMISKKCDRIRTACKGGYCFKMRRGSEGVTYADRPDKHNPYTHISDALQYGALAFRSGYVQSRGPQGAPVGDGQVHALPVEQVNADGWT